MLRTVLSYAQRIFVNNYHFIATIPPYVSILFQENVLFYIEQIVSTRKKEVQILIGANNKRLN